MSTAVVQPVPRSFGRMMGRGARDCAPAVAIFVLAMIGGMAIFKLMDGLLGGTPSASAPPSAGMERAR